MLYGCDGHWWKARNGVPEFQGLKLSQDTVACTKFLDVHKVEVKHGPRLLVDTPGLIATGAADGGGNSGFQALNLLVQFGVRRMVLVGFDMRLDRGVHWHGRHEKGLNNPAASNVIRWRRALDGVADQFADLGIEVLNASPVSMLTAYPIVNLEDAL